MARRKRSQSLVILNFFTLASIIIIVVTLTLYNRYINPNNHQSQDKTPRSFLKLSCQKDNDRFKVYSHKLMNGSLKALNQGYYKIFGDFEKKQDSVIEDITSIKNLNSFYLEAIDTKQKKDIKKYLSINYIVDETTNKDSKTFKSGTIKTDFKVNETTIFSYYSDFKFYNENELKDIIDCTIKVYKNYASK